MVPYFTIRPVKTIQYVHMQLSLFDPNPNPSRPQTQGNADVRQQYNGGTVLVAKSILFTYSCVSRMDTANPLGGLGDTSALNVHSIPMKPYIKGHYCMITTIPTV